MVKHTHTHTHTLEQNCDSHPYHFLIYSFIHVSFKKKQSAPWISSHWDQPLSFHFVESSHMELNHYKPQQRQYLEAPNGMLKHCIQVRQEFGSQKSSALLPHAHYLPVPFISKCCDVSFFFKFFFMHPSHLSFHFRDVHFNVMWATSFAGCNSGKLWMLKTSTFRWLPPHLMSRIPRKLSAHALRLRVDSPHGFATSSTKKKESKWFMAEATSPNYWVVVVGYYCWWFRNPANQLRLVVYPIIYKVLYIPGGCLGFLNHQQYEGYSHLSFQMSRKSCLHSLLLKLFWKANLGASALLRMKYVETDAKKQLMFIFHTFPKSIY